MKKFIKKNMLISIVLVFSILIVIAYILSMNQKEWFPGAGEWFNVFFQLSIGFIINFIFYITQVYFPQQKQQKQAYKCVALRIKQIISHMNDIFIQLGEIYLDDYCSGNDITDEQLLIILNKLNINDEVHVTNPRKIGMTNQHFTTKEWIVSQVEFIESNIDKLYNYYSTYVSPELMDVLERILKSTIHTNIARSLFQLPNGISFKELKEDIFFLPYYKLMKELSSIKNDYSLS